MSFEICDPGIWRAVAPLAPGQATLTKRGYLKLHDADLMSIGAGQRVLVLADRDTWRIALRAAKEDELGRATRVTAVQNKKNKAKPSGRSQVNIGRALKRLDVTGAAAAGRYTLSHTKMDGRATMLFITLTDGRAEAARVPAAEPARGKGK